MALVFGLATAAGAHVSQRGGGPVAGVPIPEITHGQMPIVAGHVREILGLAGRQFQPDPDFRRVLNYARIQRSYCLWGLVPGSISDEASPFNACSHAYLAASRDLLLRMVAEGRDSRAADLALRIDHEMMLSSTALDLCSYSASPYDTATTVRPVWSDVPGHAASLTSLLAIAALLAGAAALFERLTGRGRVPAGTDRA
ncbi:hypothetical protein [Frigidibacter mobilis]|uniref:Uncharacterized protein n=1 Tax=Frigidibacter mobilis TaxID=1335048 RepID=A0A159YXZ7_9RHOB|nr:hypothetical protein [Frigidibacter mobilis]AMY67312.1 hypothetical protein AKL17_0050 [Frigidibacter mobilis]